MSKIRTFTLVRTKDPSGVSGTGTVAEGVVFHDGQTILSWFGVLHTVEVSPDIETVERIHGHGGLTKVVWDDEKSARCHRTKRLFKHIKLAKRGTR